MFATDRADVSFCCTAVDIAPALQASQFLTIVNTVISLLGSCFATFAVSALVDNRFNIMHVQACALAVAR